MKRYPHLILCEHCDAVYRRNALKPHEAARCSRCEATLFQAQRLTLDEWLALSITAAVVYVIANVYPVIRISMQGMHHDTTVWKAVEALAQGAAAPISLAAAFTVLIVPLLQISLLIWILAHARAGIRAPGFAAILRMLQHLRPWSMIEVCLLGILVAIVKLSGLLDVSAGVGVWAIGSLTILITLITRRDINRLWSIGAEENP